jgi:hypothetical protein
VWAQLVAGLGAGAPRYHGAPVSSSSAYW